MPSFEVFIDDDRYSVPSLYLITAANAARAQAQAEHLLRESRHHRRVELRCDGVLLSVTAADDQPANDGYNSCGAQAS